MTESVLVSMAEKLHDAERGAFAIPQLSADQTLSLDDAYQVQSKLIRLRELEGEKRTGLKLGFTSVAKARQMGVEDVILGTITDSMHLSDGDEVDTTRLVHARVEPELAFLIGDDADPMTATDPLSCVEAVAPALEIIDSRYKDFRFSLSDVVADNTSAARFVVGDWTPMSLAPDLRNRGVLLSINGQVVEHGSTSAILGNPYRAVRSTVRMAARYGLQLLPGDIILAGAATAAAPLPAQGLVQASISQLSSVTIRTKDS